MRLASVKSRNAAKPPQHVREVAAEDAAVAVQFVENDVAQVFKQARPARVMRQDAGVQHVRVCQYDVALLANRFPRVARSVAIVSEYAEAVCEPPAEVVKLGQLILRQSLRGEQIQRARVRIFQDGVQDRQVVTQRFSRGGWRHYDNVFPCVNGFGGGGLVRVELPDAFSGVRGRQIRMDPGRHVGPLCFAGRKMADGGEDFIRIIAPIMARSIVGREGIEQFGESRRQRRAGRAPDGERMGHERHLSVSPYVRRTVARGAPRRKTQLFPRAQSQD